ncbi:hypothetical protein O181_001222 [Austropuccinia psidii MF-1]|uniref:Uncharacterized protein n=1 Tax=Austropuccinia psidii MF-1 TaxID=1389203 RepID=A0A9Q3BAE1_9BASI|nr:hypothetical protein [Austropuccinia psidii MF-1]
MDYSIPVGTTRTKKKDQKIDIDHFQNSIKEISKIKKSENQRNNKEEINMNSELLSKIPHNPMEYKEETMKGHKYFSDAEIIHKKDLSIQQELIELLKKEGKRKESSFTAENSPMEEPKTIQRIFRQQKSPSPSSRPMAASATFTSKQPNTLTKRVNINTQDSNPLQKEIPGNSTPIVKIRPKDYSLWFDGKEVERSITRAANIAKFEEIKKENILLE